MMMTLSWPRSAQKVQAAHNLIMVLGRTSTPGLARHLCIRPPLLLLSPSAPAGLAVHLPCVALPPALKTLRFTPLPPCTQRAPCAPACIIVALSSPPSKSADGCLFSSRQPGKSCTFSRIFAGACFHMPADILTRRL